MRLKDYLHKKYKIDEKRIWALIESGLIKVGDQYIRDDDEINDKEVKVPSLLLSIGWEFFDLLKITKKHEKAFSKVRGVKMIHTNDTEYQFFRLAGLLRDESPFLLYTSNLYPLDIQKHLNGSIRLVIMKYTNNYEEFRFKKELLDELLKNKRFTLLDVFLSLYSYNQYLVYELK